MKNETEELINRLDPNRVQCCKCDKWIHVKDAEPDGIDYYCIKCFESIWL